MKLSVTATLAIVAAVALSGAATAKNLRASDGGTVLREAYRGYFGEQEEDAKFDSGELPGDREESDDDPYEGDFAGVLDGVLDERELLSSDVEELDSFDGNTEEEGDNEEPDLSAVPADGRELKHKKKHGHKKKKKHGHKKKRVYKKKKHCYKKCHHGHCRRYCK